MKILLRTNILFDDFLMNRLIQLIGQNHENLEILLRKIVIYDFSCKEIKYEIINT